MNSRFGWRRTLISGAIIAVTVVAGAFLAGSFRSTPPARAFYFWRTQWVASPEILANLKSGGIDHLYMRFFDVEWNPAEAAAVPVSPLHFQSPLPEDLEIVPVVYLTNAVFLNIRAEDVAPLADNVWRKVSTMAGGQHLTFRELQIDCDWSDSSRDKYFHFAELLNRKLHEEHKIVSATIRLHQIKYAERTGIPPVARGMLMFYNFRQIQADSALSSIFNAEDAARYASFISGYPMQLDVVLPMFSWSIHSRGGRVLGLMEETSTDDAAAFEGFQKDSPGRFSAVRSFFFHGRYFMAGDRLAVEQTTPELTHKAALLAKRGAGRGKPYGTVALFDLNERNLKTYTTAEIGGILDAF